MKRKKAAAVIGIAAAIAVCAAGLVLYKVKFEEKRCLLYTSSQTLVQILYMEELVRPELLDELDRRLESFEIDGVMDSGIVEHLACLLYTSMSGLTAGAVKE